MANIRIDADAQKALAEFEKTVRALGDVGDGMDDVADKSRKGAAEERRLANLRNKLLRETDTAQERLERRLQDVTKALKGTGVSEERLGRIRKKLMAEHQKQLEKQEGQLDENADAADKSFGSSAIGKVRNFVLGLASVQQAVQFITTELEAQQDLFDRASDTQITVDQSRAGLRRNLVGLDASAIGDIQLQLESLADTLNLSEVQINRAAADAISASGGDVAASLAAVTQAARFSQDSPENISLLAGTLLDIKKATGSRDAETNLGFLATLGSAGRVVDVRQQASNLAPGVIGTLAFGGDAKTSGALLAALTNAGADFTGARSSTALIALAEQLDKFDTAVSQDDTADGRSFRQADTLAERLRLVQSSSGLQDLFLRDASFEKQVKGVIIQLLTDGTSQAAQQFTQNLGLFGSDAELAAVGRSTIENLRAANPLQRTAAVDRAIARARERGQIGDTSNALSRPQIESIQEILQRSGQFASESRARSFTSRLDGDGVTVSDAVSLLRDRADAILTTQTSAFTAGSAGGVRVNREANEAERESAAKLDRLADQLEKLLGATVDQTKEIKKRGQGNSFR